MERRAARHGSTPSAGVEWQGGIFPLPGLVGGEGEPYRPEVLFWMGADGAILGSEMGREGALLAVAEEHLEDTIRNPGFGRPHTPTRVRVASSELAETLRRAFPSIEIVCGPTPELDGAASMFMDTLAAKADDGDAPYLTEMTDDATCRSFCGAAAGLYRAAPWEVVPTDAHLLGVTIEALGIHRAVLSVIGQVHGNRGIVLFRSLADYDDFREAVEELEAEGEPLLPAHLSLNFETEELIPPGLLREIEEHGWDVAAEDAYPWLIPIDPDLEPRPPTPDEVGYAEAVALALPRILEEDADRLAQAWEHDEPMVRTVRVKAAAEEVQVTFEVPAREERAQDIPI